jgi:apolipoprotein D and lipocalin family protein
MKNILLLLPLMTLLSACGSQNLKPIHTVEHVDLERFMGDWYVVANIPTFIETDAYNAIETYAMNDDGSIATTFTFHDGSPDGELKKYEPTGFIVDEQSNALWDMQFIWPFKAEYRVIYLDADYQTTIIGRTKRDYVWLMSRQPAIEASSYASLLAFLEEQGYDISKVQKVPQVWSREIVNEIGSDINSGINESKAQ